MVELFKLAIEKPLNAIVVALCAVTFSLHAGLANTSNAVASLETKQLNNDLIHSRVTDMMEIVIRTDENVKYLTRMQAQRLGESPAKSYAKENNYK